MNERTDQIVFIHGLADFSKSRREAVKGTDRIREEYLQEVIYVSFPETGI